MVFKRLFSITLAAALLAGSFGAAESGVTAADALFGGAVAYDAPVAEPADDGATDGGDEEDMYGSNDTASRSTYPTLRLGDSDSTDGVAYIVFMQNRLIELGYLDDAADGTYGENTQVAVREFQKANGLEATGIADPETQQKVYSDTSTLVLASPDTTLFGSDTMRVQNALAQWGFMFSQVDGKMGDNTRVAIKDFKEYMMTVDPEYGATPTPAPTNTPAPTPEGGEVFDDMPVASDELLEGVTPIVLHRQRRDRRAAAGVRGRREDLPGVPPGGAQRRHRRRGRCACRSALRPSSTSTAPTAASAACRSWPSSTSSASTA